MPIFVVVVQAISDDEGIGDNEPAVVGLERDDLAATTTHSLPRNRLDHQPRPVGDRAAGHGIEAETQCIRLGVAKRADMKTDQVDPRKILLPPLVFDQGDHALEEGDLMHVWCLPG